MASGPYQITRKAGLAALAARVHPCRVLVISRRARSETFALAVLFSGCASPSPPPAPAQAATAPAPAELPSAVAIADAPDAGPVAAAPEPPLDVAPILFPDAATTPPSAARCASIQDERGRTRCLFTARYEGDSEALRIAVELHETSGDVAGVQVEQDMDGGFRGKIHLVPEPPVGKHRRHLAWIAFARRDLDAFFASLAPDARGPIRFRHRPLAYRFFRSVGRTTPSAYAEGFTVSYNVSGSLHASAEAVRDTIFHEVFHLNDAAHGDWSMRALREIFDSIVARCGTRVACLKPYAPGDTMVRGGTYYAFQPDNGESVHEYAAELALRYFREQRAARVDEKPSPKPGAAAPGRFKCGPDENRRAWTAIVDEFFGGADATPSCSPG